MCNAASFYLDATPYGGNNCWTKTLSIPCELPSDALMDPNAILLLQETECTSHLLVMNSVACLCKRCCRRGDNLDPRSMPSTADQTVDMA